jgi:formylglycine-generating enzyme required for sulfatase activity
MKKIKAKYRVSRGGAWRCDAGFCRSTDWYDGWPGYLRSLLGFRLIRRV